MWSWKLCRSVIDKTAGAASVTTKLAYRSCSSTVQKTSEVNIHSTIDASDVDTFSKQMKEWWNPDGKLGLLHSFNIIRVPYIRDGLVQCSNEDRKLLPLKDFRILDVGCGGGILSEALARLGASVTGIDASKELIEVAEGHKTLDPKIANNKPIYINTTVEDHVKTTAGYYNCVVASEVIEHVQNPELFVKSCVKALKPGGKIFLTTPNRTRLSQFVVIFLAESVLRAIPQGAHQYDKFITPTELTFMLEKNNCQVESTFGVQFNPVTKKWSFCDYQHLMYAIEARKLS